MDHDIAACVFPRNFKRYFKYLSGVSFSIVNYSDIIEALTFSLTKSRPRIGREFVAKKEFDGFSGMRMRAWVCVCVCVCERDASINSGI